ncbi:hypothetical protein SAMN05444287_1965 [Octadecabacter temperatus]|uniref:Uncharacterized protein n=1 Tax=Octadecabacter temperatus TaxID=1458307 RepID=A0A0K0Y7I3_9RHOB|nr:hypothetical protein [Octadecabacter temperatus]AKS46841.1 hypothetical protein OSB_23050 [Octadecabacter temperatus]SIO22303.1 hypothetical protein SAMN05444287_1965 [Octadecabacter temperatus]
MQKGDGKIWIWGGAFIALLTLSKFIPFYILAVFIVAGVLAAILWDSRRKSAPPKRTVEPKPAGTFKTPLGAVRVFDDLDVHKTLHLRHADGVTFVEVELQNNGDAPLGPLSFELAITFSNFFGNPAKSGNHLDGFVLSPAPEPITLTPKEQRKFIVYRSDAPSSLPSGEGRHARIQAVLNDLKTAPDLISYLENDRTEAFHLNLRVGDHSHTAYLTGAQINGQRP